MASFTDKSKSKPKAKTPPMKKPPLKTASRSAPKAAPKATAAKRPAPAAEPAEDLLADLRSDELFRSLMVELGERTSTAVNAIEDAPEELASLWQHLKKTEQVANAARQAVEEALVLLFELEEGKEEVNKFLLGGYEITIASKLKRTVNSDKLTALSEEYEIDDDIARLFRFKPELNLAVYRAESEEKQEFFADVITATPARPSFTITAEE